jgi:hypothetical protein
VLNLCPFQMSANPETGLLQDKDAVGSGEPSARAQAHATLPMWRCCVGLHPRATHCSRDANALLTRLSKSDGQRAGNRIEVAGVFSAAR